MNNSEKPKLHLVMFPWIGMGHIISFSTLSNDLANRSHRISFLLPKKGLLKLQNQNIYSELIKFYTVAVPHVEGLPLRRPSTQRHRRHRLQRLLADERKVAVEVERGENAWFSKEDLCMAIKSLMDEDSEMGKTIKQNHLRWKETLSKPGFYDNYIDNFIKNMHEL